MNIPNIPLDSKYLDFIFDYMYKNLGIFVESSKRNLLAQKLSKLMEKAEITDIGEYYHYIVSPAISDRQKMIQDDFMDTVTVHKTNFFRENNHFEFIKAHIKEIIDASPMAKITGEVRIWSAACSTGEEPYTLAMVMKEILPPHMRVKILATDISPDSIRKALEGRYKFGPEDYISSDYVNKYFTKVGDHWTINDDVKSCVTFRLFNLMDSFPFKKPFDIIFCRNVMIYFDKYVQERLVNKFYDALAPKGYLFIGHSESLIQLKHSFNYSEPTVYQK